MASLLADTTPRRTRSPATLPPTTTLPTRIRAWLNGHPWAPPSGVASRGAMLLPAQRDFVHELADLRSVEAGRLQFAVWRARSLQDLWHLRVAVFAAIAHRLGQQEAEARLLRLNRHFPTRSPRSGLGALLTAPGPLAR